MAIRSHVNKRTATGLALLIVGVALLIGTSAQLALAQNSGPPVDVGPPADFVSEADVVTAFRAAGLDVQNLARDPVGGSPGGSPGSEREAWTFVINPSAGNGSPHPFTGRIMVFDSAQGLQAKATWGQRIGSTFIQHRNILLWLDTDLDPSVAARYRQALAGMR